MPQGNPDLSLSEEDVKFRYITPAIENAGWVKENIKMEYSLNAGRVVLAYKEYARRSNLRADYVLFDRDNYPIAIVEAKTNTKFVETGIQQAMEYAQMLDVKFAYSSNGEGFVEHDFLTGQEKQISLNEFPSPNELKKRLREKDPLTPEEEKIVNTPYYFDSSSHEPRYYQRIAINRTVEAIAKGKNRILLVMATGTGKTYTAFQIIHRLHKSGAKKKILYLADRNILIDQTMSQDFKPFRKVMTKVKNAKIDPAYEVYMALYHQLVGNEEKGEPDPFLQVEKSFFDLIIVDECHRGSARDDSAWRKVLEYFSSATQIGMTATPKTEEGASNLDYFGEPLYTYSLKQGINDGFLAPYCVTNCVIDIDEEGYMPSEGERDIHNRLIEQRLYTQKDFGKTIAIQQRREVVARRITRMLHEIGRMTKTIVFCPDIEEAGAMRELLVNMNSDFCQKDPRYVMRITSDDKEGKRQLDNFIDVNEPYPTVVTTSELLSTGVDCKMCGLIVIDKNIESMTEFKQIVGRGTRLLTDKGKWHLEILDFRNATKKFEDPDFDGDPLDQSKEEKLKHKDKPDPDSTRRTDPLPNPDPTAEKRTKFTVHGEPYQIVGEDISLFDENGQVRRAMSIADFNKFAKEQILNLYGTLEDFALRWNDAKQKQKVIDELKDRDVLIEALAKQSATLSQADAFDIICYVAYGQEPLTRRQRADRVKNSNFFNSYEKGAREVLEALLEKYIDHGICDIENVNILATPPFTKIGAPPRIVERFFGGLAGFEQALRKLEQELYSTPQP